MAIDKFTKDMDIIAALDNEPNDTGGLTAEQLKGKFDEGGKAIKAYLNETVATAIDQQEADAAALKAVKHTHSNKALLDTYTQTEANLADAVTKKHSHPNKEVLDGIAAVTQELGDAADKVPSESAVSAAIAAAGNLPAGGVAGQALVKKSNESYDTQWDTLTAARVGAYSKDEVDAFLSEKPNHNLLDNWYFGNPVNQRGKTEYTSGYTIDRWKLSLWQSTSPSLTISDGYITLSNNTADGTPCSCNIQQIIDNPEQFAGQTVTFSVLLGAVAKGSGKLAIAISVNGSTESVTEIKIANENSIVSRTLTLPSEVTSLNVYIGQNANNAGKGTFSIQLKAAKLELGDRQTLAHQGENGVWQLNEIPDYGEQLRRCQRYFYRINSSDKQYHSGSYTIVSPFMVNSSGNRAVFRVPSPMMRKLPTVSAIGSLYVKYSGGGTSVDISNLTQNAYSNDESGTAITFDTTNFPANTFGVAVMDSCDIILNAEL